MSSAQDDGSKGPVANRSVSRAVGILRALAASDAPMTATDVAKRIGLPRPTTFRLLMTLEDEGIVDRQDTLYSLGWDLARIGQTVDPASGLVPRVKAIVEEFAEEVSETVTFSLRRGRYDLDLVVQATPRQLGFTMSEMYGMKWPHHASATGKLLLADLSTEKIALALGDRLDALTDNTITDFAALDRELQSVRRQGWAVTAEELEEGVTAFAAPVRDSIGALVGAVSVVGPTPRMETKRQDEDLPDRLVAAAHRVEERLHPAPEEERHPAR